MIKVIESMEGYHEILKSDKPVMLCFKATWCGPCKAMNPILEDFALNNDWADVATVDIDVNDDLSTEYSIQKLPTTILFKNGEVVGERMYGVLSKHLILSKLKSLI